MWKYYALLSAIFAALTALFAKIGVKDIDSNLATAIRTSIVLIITWGIVALGDGRHSIREITTSTWIWLIFSGVATGVSWLFYFKALQTGELSKVAPIDKLSVPITVILAFLVLGEQVTLKVLTGVLLITAGSIILLL
ncbi:MAG: EamA family transporter [Prevotella sp.]